MKTEFEEAGQLLEGNRDAVTISIDDEDVKPEKQRKAAGFTPDDDDDDFQANDDKSEVWTRLTLCGFLWTIKC